MKSAKAEKSKGGFTVICPDCGLENVRYQSSVPKKTNCSFCRKEFLIDYSGGWINPLSPVVTVVSVGVMLYKKTKEKKTSPNEENED